MKRKRIQSSDLPDEAALAASSTKQKIEKMILPDWPQKDKKHSYLSKPHMLFK